MTDRDAARVEALQNEVAYWRADLGARLWRDTALYLSALKAGELDRAAEISVRLSPALAAYDAAEAGEWHDRCEACGEFVLPNDPRVGGFEICGHARCLTDDGKGSVWPHGDKDLAGRAEEARDALSLGDDQIAALAESDAAPAADREGVTLDERLKAAGMFTVAEMMGETPLTRWEVHSGMTDLKFFGEWLDRKVAEYIRMNADYELGDKEKGDELYEWVIAHSAAFKSIRTNFRAALASTPTQPASPILGDLVEALEKVREQLASAANESRKGEVWSPSLDACREADDIAALALKSARTAGSAGKVVAPDEARHGWCQPGDDPVRKWIVKFEDADMGHALFDNEAAARKYFDEADGGGWNCFLFAAAPRAAAPVPQSLATTEGETTGDDTGRARFWKRRVDTLSHLLAERDAELAALRTTPTTNETARPVATEGGERRDLFIPGYLHDRYSAGDIPAGVIRSTTETARPVAVEDDVTSPEFWDRRQAEYLQRREDEPLDAWLARLRRHFSGTTAPPPQESGRAVDVQITDEILKAGYDAYAAHEWDAGRAKRGPEREGLRIAFAAMLRAAAPSSLTGSTETGR